MAFGWVTKWGPVAGSLPLLSNGGVLVMSGHGEKFWECQTFGAGHPVPSHMHSAILQWAGALGLGRKQKGLQKILLNELMGIMMKVGLLFAMWNRRGEILWKSEEKTERNLYQKLWRQLDKDYLCWRSWGWRESIRMEVVRVNPRDPINSEDWDLLERVYPYALNNSLVFQLQSSLLVHTINK